MNAQNIFMYVLGALIVLSFVILLGILIFVGVPDVNMELLYLAVGALIGQTGTVVSYFFGSSRGSDKKTEILADSQKKV